MHAESKTASTTASPIINGAEGASASAQCQGQTDRDREREAEPAPTQAHTQAHPCARPCCSPPLCPLFCVRPSPMKGKVHVPTAMVLTRPIQHHCARNDRGFEDGPFRSSSPKRPPSLRDGDRVALVHGVLARCVFACSPRSGTLLFSASPWRVGLRGGTRGAALQEGS
jgi:hypothetical protein